MDAVAEWTKKFSKKLNDEQKQEVYDSFAEYCIHTNSTEKEAMKKWLDTLEQDWC